MFGYMWLGAWLLTLVIIGIIVISTGLPDDGTGDSFGETFVVWSAKIIYLIVLAITFYKMGAHFVGI